MNKKENKIKKIKNFYKNHAALVTSPFIDSDLALNDNLLKSVTNSLSISFENKVILDVGCGSGLLSAFFERHRYYMGIDLNDRTSFQILKDESHHFTQANALELPVSDSVVDVAICMDSFEHFPDQLAAAQELKRVLKPSGFIFLSIPNYSNIAGLVKYWCEHYGNYDTNTWAPFDYWRPEELEHFITPKHISQIFKKAGFSQFRYIGYDEEMVVGLFPWVWHPKIPNKISAAVSKSVSLFSKPLCKVWPAASLHTFWKIN